MYCIAETVEKGVTTCCIAPTNWVQGDILKWPKFKGPALMGAVKKCLTPQHNWISLSTKILKTNIASYDEALDYEQRYAAYTDDESFQKGVSSEKPLPNFDDCFIEDGSSSPTLMSLDTPPSSQKPPELNKSTNNIMDGLIDGIASVSSTVRQEECRGNCNTNFIMEELNNLKLAITNFHKDFTAYVLENKQRDIQVSETSKMFPLKSENELNEFEKDLAVAEYSTNMVNYFKQIGGSSDTKILKGILEKLATDEVYIEYSLFGTKEKKRFDKLSNIIDLLKKTTKSRSTTITDHCIMTYLTTFLKHAKERLARKAIAKLQQNTL